MNPQAITEPRGSDVVFEMEDAATIEQTDLGTLEHDLQTVVTETMRPCARVSVAAGCAAMRKPWVAWGGVALALVLVVAATILDVAYDGDLFSIGLFALLGLPFAVVGALIAARLPDLSIGWLMLVTGLSLAVANITDGIIYLALSQKRTPAIGGWAASISSICNSAFFLLLVSTLFLLPNGRLPSRRWGVVKVLVGALAVCDVLLVVNPGIFSDWDKEGVRNPIGIDVLGGVLGVVDGIQAPLTVALLLGSIASVAIRFRGARGVERAQLRWIAVAVLATGTVWLGMAALNLVTPNSQVANASWGAAFASVGLIPIGIGLAVLRYRLYEIDRVVSKTLLYASLTLVLGATYVGLVLLGQAVSSAVTGSSSLSVAVSTLVVAALFLPVRARLQRVVDRRFNRHRYDTQRTLEGFGLGLREQVDLGTLERDLQMVVAETMQPSHVTLWRNNAVQ